MGSLLFFGILGDISLDCSIFMSIRYSSSRFYFQMLGLLLLFSLAAAAPDDRVLSIVTWNVNGVRKFDYLPNEIAFLRSHDIVLLQETFTRDDAEFLELRDFSSHHARALPGQSEDRRNIWGLSSFFRVESFCDGYWEQLYSPMDWLICSRWKSPSNSGLIVLNAYIPLHTRGIKPDDVQMLLSTFEDLLSTFPGDSFVVAGDFNVDRDKLCSSASRPSATQKTVMDFIRRLESWDFKILPETGVSFTGNRGVESLLDYVAVDQGSRIIEPPSFHIGPKVSHRAVSMKLSVYLPILGKFMMLYFFTCISNISITS
jgi:exonuclease III